MTKYLFSRLLQALFVLWAAFTIAFILLQAMPGDAIMIRFLSPDLGLTPDQVEQIRASYGVDTPVWLQYIHSLLGFLKGDWGFSVQTGIPVSQSILTNLPPTLLLAVLGFIAAVILAVGLTFWAVLTPSKGLSQFIRSLPPLFISMPVFWVGTMLIQIFSFKLNWIPVINPGRWEGLILPVITIALPISAPLAQILLRNFDVAIVQPYVAVARAKGASREWVLIKHVAKNAIIPTLTIAGVLFGELLVGAVVTETVYGLNGLGNLTQQAVNNQDATILQAVVVFSALMFVLINLIVDLLYPFFDPRLRIAIGGK